MIILLILTGLVLSPGVFANRDYAVELQAAQAALSAGDYDKAFAEYRRYAGQYDNPLAQFSLGLFFENGWGRAIDRRAACQWYEKAASGGIPTANHFSGDCLAAGIHRKADPVAAAEYYREAARLGHIISLCSLAELYMQGKGVSKDPAKGLTHCEQAAVKGLLPAQDTVASEKMDRVDFHDGRLSVSADDTSLFELMQLVGTEAAFEVVTFANHDSQTGSWSFSNLPLPEAIETLLSGTSAIIVYGRGSDGSGEPSVAAVYLLGPRSALANMAAEKTQESSVFAHRFNTIEPNLANQILMDRIRYGDLQDRVQAIDRLAGLSDDITVTTLVFSLEHDPSPAVRAHAATALEQIGGETAATALETGLGDVYPSVRTKVVQALGNVQDERVSLWLGQILMGEPIVDVRLQAVQAMAQQGGDTARIFLQAAADDSSSVVSEAALGLLESRD